MAGPILKRVAGDQLLSDRVAGELRDAIVEGRLRPGERLIEANLAEQLGVSTVPVREAFLRLEREGLIRTVPYRGRYVWDFTEQETRDIYRVRRALDELAYSMIDEQGGLSPEALQRLQNDIDQVAAAIAASDYRRAAELDFSFHDHIYAEADSDILHWMWEALRPRLQVFYYWRVVVNPERTTAETVEHHTAVLNRLIAGGLAS